MLSEECITKHARNGVLSAIGNTPLVRLSHVLGDIPFKLYGKLEMLNPGGSIKDRTAISILEHGVDTGKIKAGTVVVESTSGNMGIGLAQACLQLGFRFVCVVDPKTTQQNIRILEAYGAELDYVSEPDPDTGEYLQARLNRVKYQLRTINNSFWPNQYANPYNTHAHKRTMHEIVSQLDGKLDYLFCATSTCGTMRGCAEYVREHHLNTKIMAVDAVGSVIFGCARGTRLIPGHGAAVTPALFLPNLAHKAIHVTDIDCIVGCRRLARTEAILAGGSSGAVIMAVEQVQHTIEPDATCALIFPDRGERYLDTIYSNEWVEKHFGCLNYLYENPVEEEILVAGAA
jgi:N-(2-amino-2-carboxyethyl)-L-glutamate synthase